MMNMMNPMMIQQQQAMMQQNLMNQMMMQQNPQNMMNQANMMNQFNNQNLNQQQQQNNINSFQPETPDTNNITVSFKLQIKDQAPKPLVTIQCSLNDKVSTIIQAYRNKTQDFDAEHEKFIYNAKKLNETLTCAEAGIINNSVIFVLNDKDVDGGY